MDTTSCFGVYLLLKNKVFGSLCELFINSCGVMKGLIGISSLCYKKTFLCSRQLKTLLGKNFRLTEHPTMSR